MIVLSRVPEGESRPSGGQGSRCLERVIDTDDFHDLRRRFRRLARKRSGASTRVFTAAIEFIFLWVSATQAVSAKSLRIQSIDRSASSCHAVELDTMHIDRTLSCAFPWDRARIPRMRQTPWRDRQRFASSRQSPSGPDYRDLAIVPAPSLRAPTGPRTLLTAGHSKTPLSVKSTPYLPGSRLRYACSSRAFSESIPATSAAAAGALGFSEQAMAARDRKSVLVKKTCFTARQARRRSPAFGREKLPDIPHLANLVEIELRRHQLGLDRANQWRGTGREDRRSSSDRRTRRYPTAARGLHD